MKKTVIILLFFLGFNAFAQVGIGTLTPLSTLDVNGNLSLKVVTLNGGASGNATLINDSIYISLNPTSGSDEFYIQDATAIPGRTYILRNISSTTDAKVFAADNAGGNDVFFYAGNSNTSNGGGNTPLTIPSNGSTKTIIIISDGTNWTYLGFD